MHFSGPFYALLLYRKQFGLFNKFQACYLCICYITLVLIIRYIKNLRSGRFPNGGRIAYAFVLSVESVVLALSPLLCVFDEACSSALCTFFSATAPVRALILTE